MGTTVHRVIAGEVAHAIRFARQQLFDHRDLRRGQLHSASISYAQVQAVHPHEQVSPQANHLIDSQVQCRVGSSQGRDRFWPLPRRQPDLKSFGDNRRIQRAQSLCRLVQEIPDSAEVPAGMPPGRQGLSPSAAAERIECF
jgi:hypothetical protein